MFTYFYLYINIPSDTGICQVFTAYYVNQ